MIKEIKLTTGELIMFFRNRKGFTQAELGQMVFGDLQTPNVKIKKIEKGQQQTDKEDIEKIAAALGVTPELLQHGKITIPLADDTTSEPPKKEYTYQITKKMDNICPNFSTYLTAINSMADVDDMDLMFRIFQKMCAEILSTTNSTQNNKAKSTRLPKSEALGSLDPGNV